MKEIVDKLAKHITRHKMVVSNETLFTYIYGIIGKSNLFYKRDDGRIVQITHENRHKFVYRAILKYMDTHRTPTNENVFSNMRLLAERMIHLVRDPVVEEYNPVNDIRRVVFSVIPYSILSQSTNYFTNFPTEEVYNSFIQELQTSGQNIELSTYLVGTEELTFKPTGTPNPYNSDDEDDDMVSFAGVSSSRTPGNNSDRTPAWPFSKGAPSTLIGNNDMYLSTGFSAVPRPSAAVPRPSAASVPRPSAAAVPNRAVGNISARTPAWMFSTGAPSSYSMSE